MTWNEMKWNVHVETEMKWNLLEEIEMQWDVHVERKDVNEIMERNQMNWMVDTTKATTIIWNTIKISKNIKDPSMEGVCQTSVHCIRMVGFNMGEYNHYEFLQWSSLNGICIIVIRNPITNDRVNSYLMKPYKYGKCCANISTFCGI